MEMTMHQVTRVTLSDHQTADESSARKLTIQSADGQWLTICLWGDFVGVDLVQYHATRKPYDQVELA